MADIKQAAKWMQDGKRVRRSAMPSWVVAPSAFHGVIVRVNDPEMGIAGFEAVDLLADDWEIAE